VVDWVELGRVGSPFGIRGWVHVRSYTDPPQALLDYPEWHLRDPSGERLPRRVAEGRPHGPGLVVRFEGFEDRNAAESLKGAVVEVPRVALPPLGERQHYRVDLLGLSVRNLEGVELGVLDHFIDAPAHPVMVVLQDGRERWVPLTPQHLVEVDQASGRIVVDWPAELE